MSVPALRFPEFEGEWVDGRLGDVSRFSKGKGISKADIVEGGKLPCIRYGELYTTYGRIIENIVSFTNVDKAGLRMSEGGEILVPASGETSYDIATATVLPFGGVAIGGDLNVIETNENGFFIASYLSGVGKKHLARMAQGNSVVHLYKDQIASSRIKLPIIAEQKKIAAFLGVVDDKLAALTSKRDLLIDYKRGLMQKLFSQELRFTKPNGQPFPDWEEKRLGEVVSIKTGRKDVNEGNPNGVFPFFTCAREHTFSDTFSFDCEAVLIAGNGDVGHCKKFVGKFEAYQRTYVLSSFKLDFEYTYIFLANKFERYVLNQKQVGAMPYIKLGDLKSFPIPVPHPDEQQKIADALSALDAKISTVAAQITALQDFKKGLLQQMFV